MQGLAQLMPLLLMFAIIYLLLIRPQVRKQREHREMLGKLKRGDEVCTQGGLVGRISSLKDGEVTLQIQEGVRVRVIRSAITGLYKSPEAKSQDAAKSG